MTAEQQFPAPAAEQPMEEARSQRREPMLNLPGIIVALIALCALIHLGRTYFLTSAGDFWVVLHFAFIPLRYSGGYELDVYAFMAPVTYSLLHGNAPHLIVNMIWLAAFGSPLANRIGTVRFILFWVATSVAAVGLHYVLHAEDVTPLVGASGAISGMMGAAARYLFQVDRRLRRPAFSGAIRSDLVRLRMVAALLGKRISVAFWRASWPSGCSIAGPAASARLSCLNSHASRRTMVFTPGREEGFASGGETDDREIDPRCEGP